MRLYIISLGFLLLVCRPVAGFAQNQNQNLPTLPEPIQALVSEGAQIRYLGQVNGLDGWVTIRKGQEQYFYVTPDQKNFVMGVLFADDGRMLTIDQVQSLREREGDVLDVLTSDQLPQRPRLDELAEQATAPVGEEFVVNSPSEQLLRDMEQSNWITLGDSSAPYIYALVDPQCPHCHAYISDLRKGFIETGKLQVRLVPIGRNQEAIAQAAFLLAAPDPQQAWFKHLDGDKNALPANSNINQQGVQHNLALVKNWEIDVTPFTVYRDRTGKVKIIRGRANDPQTIVNDVSR